MTRIAPAPLEGATLLQGGILPGKIKSYTFSRRDTSILGRWWWTVGQVEPWHHYGFNGNWHPVKFCSQPAGS